MDEQEQLNQEQMPEEQQNSNADVQQAMRGVQQVGSGVSNLAKKGLSHVSPGGMGKKGIPSKGNNKGNSIAKRDNKPLGSSSGGAGSKLPKATPGGSKLPNTKSLSNKSQGSGSSFGDKLKGAIGNKKEESKDGKSSGIGDAVKKAGGKAANQLKAQANAAIKKGVRQVLMKLLASPAGPYVLAGIAIAGAVIILLLIILIMLMVMGGGASAAYSGSGSYSYTGDTTDHLTFMCTMNKPVAAYSYISSCYGWRPPFSTNFHTGTDVAAALGTEIYAVHAGTVSRVEYSDGGLGKYVEIEHDNGYYSTYGHMTEYASGIKVGKKVAQGEIIGYVGSTGNSTGPHLHLILEDKDGTFSPDPYFNIGDTGYEDCTDRDATDISKLTHCDCDSRDKNLSRTPINFEEICKNRSTSTNITVDENAIIQYLTIWEGGKICNYSGKNDGYLAYDGNDGTITIGPGMTNEAIPGYAKIIESSGYKSLFNKTSKGYQLVVDRCYPKDLIDTIVSTDVNARRDKVIGYAEELGLDLKQYQIDAMACADYNVPAVTYPALEAYKKGSYKGMWDEFKQYMHAYGGKEVEALKKRRKAEFALFVTGDYTDQGLFYSRKLNNYDDYNSEGVMSRMP